MTDDRTQKLRQDLLKKLKGLEMVLGCTVEDLLTVLTMEIGARLPQHESLNLDELALKVARVMPPIDLNAISQKISIAIEAKMAVRLDEVMSLIKQGLGEAKPDQEGMIKGVATILQPVIAQEAQKAVEAVFAANAEALKKNIGALMDSRMKEIADAASAHSTVQENQSPQTQVQASGREGLITALLNNPVIQKLMERVLNPAQQTNAALSDFNKYMSFHDLMTKIEKRVATSDDIQKGISTVFGGTQAPAPSQTTDAK